MTDAVIGRLATFFESPFSLDHLRAFSQSARSASYCGIGQRAVAESRRRRPTSPTPAVLAARRSGVPRLLAAAHDLLVLPRSRLRSSSTLTTIDLSPLSETTTPRRSCRPGRPAVVSRSSWTIARDSASRVLRTLRLPTHRAPASSACAAVRPAGSRRLALLANGLGNGAGLGGRGGRLFLGGRLLLDGRFLGSLGLPSGHLRARFDATRLLGAAARRSARLFVPAPRQLRAPPASTPALQPPGSAVSGSCGLAADHGLSSAAASSLGAESSTGSASASAASGISLRCFVAGHHLACLGLPPSPLQLSRAGR